MNWSDILPDALRALLNTLTSIDIWLQILVLLIAAAVARLAAKRWCTFVTEQLGEHEQQGLGRATYRATERMVFPLVMLFVVLIGRSIYHQFQPTNTLLDIFIPLMISLGAIRLIVFVLRRGFTPSPALRAWENMISYSVWIAVALHLLGWLPGALEALDSLAFQLGDSRISLLSVSKLILAVGLFLVLANWLSLIIERQARKSPHISASMRVGLAKFSKFFLFTLAFLIGLDSVGIDLSTLTVFGGALGVGLGFGLQRIASNFISGFILLFDRSIRPGDVISVGNRFGWVQELKARYIVVRDREGVETLIPNENLITSEVTNWSFSDRHVRVKIPVQISYDDDPEQAMQLMNEASAVNPRVLTEPAAQTRLVGFGDNGIDLQLRVWLADPENGIGSVRSDINLAIWKAFKAHDITIPFPQRVVEFRHAKGIGDMDGQADTS